VGFLGFLACGGISGIHGGISGINVGSQAEKGRSSVAFDRTAP
jgi:hypothetical protein